MRGQRYPLTINGAKSAWQRMRAKAGVKDFRFHDFRHDFATKLLRDTGNLKLVQKALNHADIKSTLDTRTSWTRMSPLPSSAWRSPRTKVPNPAPRGHLMQQTSAFPQLASDPHHLVSTARYSAAPIDLARLILGARQSKHRLSASTGSAIRYEQ